MDILAFINAKAQQFGQRYLTRPFDELPLAGVGAEVGVYFGFHARMMLGKHPQITKLHLIDPYSVTDQTRDAAEALAGATKLLHEYSGRVSFYRVSSLDASFKKEELDFIYIDGYHSYEQVNKELIHLYPFIKPKGIIGGHDFLCTGVAEAVIEFMCVNGIKGLNTKQQMPIPGSPVDWWFYK